MPRDPTEDELQQFFEEVWQLAERLAASDDSRLAARLFDLAGEVSEWRNELQARAHPPAN